jgi:hypothetical protein
MPDVESNNRFACQQNHDSEHGILSRTVFVLSPVRYYDVKSCVPDITVPVEHGRDELEYCSVGETDRRWMLWVEY